MLTNLERYDTGNTSVLLYIGIEVLSRGRNVFVLPAIDADAARVENYYKGCSENRDTIP